VKYFDPVSRSLAACSHKGHRTLSQPNFVTCSKVDQTWKCTFRVWWLPYPKTWGPKLPIFEWF